MLSTAMEIAQLSRIQWKLLSIIHRMSNGFCTVLHTDYWIDCSIISTDCSMDIAEYCLQNFYCILRNTVTDYSIDIAQYYIENSMNIAQYYPQNIPWILHSTPHKILNCYCSIISKVCSMDITECCLQNIYWILRNNVHRFSTDITLYHPENIQ